MNFFNDFYSLARIYSLLNLRYLIPRTLQIVHVSGKVSKIKQEILHLQTELSSKHPKYNTQTMIKGSATK